MIKPQTLTFKLSLISKSQYKIFYLKKKPIPGNQHCTRLEDSKAWAKQEFWNKYWQVKIYSLRYISEKQQLIETNTEMNQILELSEDFKTIIIKILQQAQFFETNQKFQQRNKMYKKDLNENYRTKKYNRTFKNFLNGLNSRIKMTGQNQ